MNADIKLGEIIRNKRQEKRMTMKELGALTGFSEVAIHHYETGYRGMSIGTFFKICKVLGLSPDEVQKECERYL